MSESEVTTGASQAGEAVAGEAVEPLSAPGPARTYRVSRRRLGDRVPHFDDFELAIEAGETVLDALLRIRKTKDPDLVVRHSCMHGSCGACGVRINGRESLACDTPVETLRPGIVKIEPLANQRLVADIATDMVDFHARFEAAGLPMVRAAETGAGVETPEGVKAFGRFENCIECGLCLSACPMAGLNGDYIGPAALAAAARVVQEPRGADLGPVLALAGERDSVWGCHDAMECSAVCPAGVEPALAVLTLRRHVAANRLKRLFRR
jgi:succinate dehydrogenase / fumarate reductase iron-sulfur subunit